MFGISAFAQLPFAAAPAISYSWTWGIINNQQTASWVTLANQQTPNWVIINNNQ